LASLKKQSEDSQKRAIENKYQQQWKALQEELKQRSALPEEEVVQKRNYNRLEQKQFPPMPSRFDRPKPEQTKTKRGEN
jgi:hypothetical protein